ncbi:hypothetical protein Sked_16430 [Sanguibacter keddieii DSM 10542]|uniref:Leucine Rich Repeat (LRR)-containing protein n=1 Tax=Sanguibacter keddieii (strain ATCC 51767 / DSM 10542 / NCFB 3025 / ST-74) TaxID=446469 RepID=D1BGK1_SANKS|nr:hypothetical protein Sked_16430 [Sanguibacter keddieii DSM 10542]
MLDGVSPAPVGHELGLEACGSEHPDQGESGSDDCLDHGRSVPMATSWPAVAAREFEEVTRSTWPLPTSRLSCTYPTTSTRQHPQDPVPGQARPLPSVPPSLTTDDATEPPVDLQPDRTSRTPRGAALWAGTSATAGILAATVLEATPAWTMLVVLVALLPAISLLAPRVRFAGHLSVVTGIGVVSLGAVLESRALVHPVPLLADGDLSTLAAGTRAYVPLALVVAGVALVLLGLGWWRRSRAWVVSGMVVVAVLAVGLLLALLARNAYLSSRYPEVPSFDVSFWFEALTWSIACVASVVAAARPPALAHHSSVPDGESTSTPAPSRRAVLVVTSLVVVGAVGGAAAWWWDGYAPRIVLADAFADPALGRCVGSMLGSTEKTSKSALADLSFLECPGKDVGDLDGIDRLQGLNTLDLSGNRLGDLTELGTLEDLRHIDLSSNAVSDLSPLAPLVQLSTLTLSSNQVQDLTPLAGMSRLVDLDVAGNQVISLAGVGSLTSLQYLVLSGNPVADLTELGQLPLLGELVAADAQIADLSPLASSTGLTRVTLDRNEVVDPSPLCGSPVLAYLAVSDNRITDASTLSGCPALSELWLGGNQVTDVSPLLEVRTLLGVDLSGSGPTVDRGVEQLRESGVYVGGLASGRG